jgi:predicted small metal-binding protein
MGVDCPWVGKAETEEEVIQMSKEHAMKDHKEWWDMTGSKMSDMEMKAMAMDKIKDC